MAVYIYMAQSDWTRLARFARRQVTLDSLHEPAPHDLLQALASGGSIAARKAQTVTYHVPSNWPSAVPKHSLI